MILVTVTGPKGSALNTAVKQIVTLHQTAGKVVRTYKHKDRPERLPADAHIVIIIEEINA